MIGSRVQRLIVVASVVVLTGGLILPDATAQETPVPEDLAPAAADAAVEPVDEFTVLLELAKDGSAGAVASLSAYLYSNNASNTEIKDRAIGLIRALSGDMLEVQAAAESIAQAAEYAVSGARIMRFDIDETYRPPDDAVAFDFGTADAELLPGFERVTEADERVEGSDELQSLRRPSGRPIISSGILGIRKFRTPMPNGTYRIVIMTDDLGEWKLLNQPLGSQIRINSLERLIVTDRPDQWIGQNYLGNLDAADYDSTRPMSGGMIVLEIEITNGFFEIELFGDEPTFLAGITLEPIEETEFEAFDPELVEIAEEIGQVLAEAITEAGEEAPVEDDGVSPS